jgi:hypothetical protein
LCKPIGGLFSNYIKFCRFVYHLKTSEMKQMISFIILLIIFKTSDITAQEYAIGADLSFLKSAEDRGSLKIMDITG